MKRPFPVIDADGHVLEHPNKMLEYAPEEYHDRIWHIDTDRDGKEWVVWDGSRDPANYFALAGAGGMSTEEQAKIAAGRSSGSICLNGPTPFIG